jgi:hypothetical protein
MADQTQTAYARSLWTDPTNLASMAAVFVGVLALPEVSAIIPPSWMPKILALSGAINWKRKREEAAREREANAEKAAPPVAPDCAHCQSPPWYLKLTRDGWLCDVCSRYTKLPVR